mmetsp:Transcript_29046/g.45552  ORF Transcript_29046/g.45552 Transcript_29046/m.45552 type:complete len:94 (-) Transcript_29046:399-680(-)
MINFTVYSQNLWISDKTGNRQPTSPSVPQPLFLIVPKTQGAMDPGGHGLRSYDARALKTEAAALPIAAAQVSSWSGVWPAETVSRIEGLGASF